MIPLAVPNLTGKEQEYTADAIASGHVGPEGPYVERFEERVARFAGREWAVATFSGTTALYVAANVLGFVDVPIACPVHAFPAARNVLESLGCTVLEEAGGHNHDFALYGVHHWPTMADCAPAIGVVAEQLTTIECYSFAANKTVTCGAGGAIVGSDISLYRAILAFISQGHSRAGQTNARMANINAAVGLAQLERLEEFLDIKRGIWERYANEFDMIERGGSRWMSTIDTSDQINLMPIVRQAAEAGIQVRDEPFRALSLPCGTTLSEHEQHRVIKTIKGLLR